MESKAATPTVTPSTFVTVLARISIVTAYFLLFVFLLNVVLWTIDLFIHWMPAATPTPPDSKTLPFSFTAWIEGAWLSGIVLLVAARGLLLRRNWGRWLFVGILVLSILGLLMNIVFELYIGLSVRSLPPSAATELLTNWMTVRQFLGMLEAFVIMDIGFTALLVWLIKRLLSEPIRAEFATLLSPSIRASSAGPRPPSSPDAGR